MISKLTGTIAHQELKYVILDVGGVGYKVYTTADTIHQIGNNKKGARGASETVTLWTHLAVRDDAMDLYGFKTLAEQNFFELLISISGIGPKTALGILNVASIEAIDSAVRSGETAHLVKVGGIGKKMAEKIVRELQDKIGDSIVSANGSIESKTATESARSEIDAIEALKSLGYSPTEARDAIKQLDKNTRGKTNGKTDGENEIASAQMTTSEKVKAALKILGQ